MLSVKDKPSERIRLRCPKCRKQNLFVTSVYTEEKAHEVDDGRITAGYVTGVMPEHIQTNAKCNDCDHKWRVRDETWCDPK